MKSFQDLLLTHDKQKRINLQQKTFSVIAARIKKLGPNTRVSDVKIAAWLASESYLTSVKFMYIRDMEITDIPCNHMKKLTLIVKERVWIINMTPTSQLSSILACVKCPELYLGNMELSEENTRALVTAMRERVERVSLNNITHQV